MKQHSAEKWNPGDLGRQIESVCPDGFRIPPEFHELFGWIEEHGSVIVDDGTYNPENKGKLSGTCSILEDLWEGQRGTHLYFSSKYHDDEWLGEWGKGRLFMFIRTGTEGSYAGLWKDENGDQKIVHLGSGSGSTLCCVLAENAVDFMRLLAIGYGELMLLDMRADQPPSAFGDIPPHPEFQQWVKNTFQVEIPETAAEIIKYPQTYDLPAEEVKDPFLRWYQQMPSPYR